MLRLKQSEVAAFRDAMYKEQGSVCLLCGQPIEASARVLDHCHTTGEVRGVLHRGCNSMLGHIENNRPRYQLTSVPRMAGFLSKVLPYIAWNLSTHRGILYPTHRTEEEKRLLRNKRARTKRAKEKLA